MTINQSSIYMWKRETTEGTAIITAVGDTTYQFGGLSDVIPDWEITSIENSIQKYWNNNSKLPILGFGNREMSVFQTKCHPNSPIPEYQFLGVGNAATPSTVAILDDGSRKDSYTIRHEGREGSSQIIQKVGCFNVGISGKIERNKDELIMQDWAWQTLEDNGDRSPLTAASQVIYPEDLRTVYTGQPEIIWDVGGAGEISLTKIYRVDWEQKQNFTIVKTGTSYTINLHEYEPVGLRLIGLSLSNNQWDAMKDKTTHDVNVKVYKQNDITKYKILKFNNCKIVKINKVGKTEEGFYINTIDLIGESFAVDFINEFTTLTDWMPNTP